MEIRQATNFLEVLELQKILDERIKSSRERDIHDMKLSLIAEIIEFNEECEGASHKTWKDRDKVFSKSAAIEEAIDILFFLAQIINESISYPEKYKLNEYFEYRTGILVKPRTLKSAALNLIYETTKILPRELSKDFSWERVIHDLKIIYLCFRLTDEEIYKRHFDKWKENYYNRVGTEWN